MSTRYALVAVPKATYLERLPTMCLALLAEFLLPADSVELEKATSFQLGGRETTVETVLAVTWLRSVARCATRRVNCHPRPTMCTELFREHTIKRAVVVYPVKHVLDVVRLRLLSKCCIRRLDVIMESGSLSVAIRHTLTKDPLHWRHVEIATTRGEDRVEEVCRVLRLPRA